MQAPKLDNVTVTSHYCRFFVLLLYLQSTIVVLVVAVILVIIGVVAAVIKVVVVEETQCRKVTSGHCSGGSTRSNSIICDHTIVTLIVYNVI